MGSPGVSYHIKQLDAPQRIRCACHAPLIVYLAGTRSHRVLSCSADWILCPSKYKAVQHATVIRCSTLIKHAYKVVKLGNVSPSHEICLSGKVKV